MRKTKVDWKDLPELDQAAAKGDMIKVSLRDGGVVQFPNGITLEFCPNQGKFAVTVSQADVKILLNSPESSSFTASYSGSAAEDT